MCTVAAAPRPAMQMRRQRDLLGMHAAERANERETDSDTSIEPSIAMINL